MGTKIIMPEMGEGIIEAVVALWLKKEGERVEQYEPILEIETDKVTTEATAEDAGTLLKIYVAAGETVAVGTLLGVIGQPGEVVSGGQDEAVAATAVAKPEPERTAVHPPASPKPTGANGSPQASRRAYGAQQTNQPPRHHRDVTKKRIPQRHALFAFKICVFA